MKHSKKPKKIIAHVSVVHVSEFEFQSVFQCFTSYLIFQQVFIKIAHIFSCLPLANFVWRKLSFANVLSKFPYSCFFIWNKVKAENYGIHPPYYYTMYEIFVAKLSHCEKLIFP